MVVVYLLTLSLNHAANHSRETLAIIMDMKIKKILLLFLMLIFQFVKSQNEYIDTSFGNNAGYSLLTYSNYRSFVDIVDIDGDFYTSGKYFNGDWFISKFDSNGILDPTFGTGGSITLVDNDGWTIDASNISSLTKTSDNKLFLITGSYPSSYPENYKTIVTKINLDGTTDNTYGTSGQYISNLPLGFKLIGVHKTNTDEIIATGYNISILPNDDTQNIIIIKITNQGLLDSTFGNNGIIELSYQYQTDTPVQAIYKNQFIYILYNNFGFGDAYIKKYNLNTLSYDLSFGTNGTLVINNSIENEDVTTFTLDNNDNIYTTGSSYTGNSLEFDLIVYKYSNNVLDLSFGNNGIINFPLIPSTNSIAIPSNTKIINDNLIVIGKSYNWDAENYEKTFFAQFDIFSGELDNSFGNNGIIINYLFNNVNLSYDYLYFDDSIVTCGFCPNGGNPRIPCLVKYAKNSNLSINEYQNVKLIAYPNPVEDLLYFNSSIIIDNVDVFDYTGKLIKSHHIDNNSLDLKYLPKGIYIIRAKNLENELKVKVLKK